MAKQDRKCLACGFSGEMRTWPRNYNSPPFIALLLLCTFIVPSLVFRIGATEDLVVLKNSRLPAD